MMSALFVGHGSPMNAIEINDFSRVWREIGAGLPRPEAILAISAHWYINATAVTAMETPSTIHDFYGFPEELFAVQYPAQGSPLLAERVAALADPVWVGQDRDSWGLDHGTWSVLTHLFPEADIPVVQLSIDASKPPSYHVDLGSRLAPLRNEGVLVVASGNVVHNLGRLAPTMPDEGYDWALRFDQAANELMTKRPGDIAELVDHADYNLAAPTPEHLLPLFYVAGIASASGEVASAFCRQPALGSLTMTGYQVG